MSMMSVPNNFKLWNLCVSLSFISNDIFGWVIMLILQSHVFPGKWVILRDRSQTFVKGILMQNILEVWKGVLKNIKLILPLKLRLYDFLWGWHLFFSGKKGAPDKFCGPKGGGGLKLFFFHQAPLQVFLNDP